MQIRNSPFALPDHATTLDSGMISRLSAWLPGEKRRERLMNLQQLRIIRETVRRNFNLTEAAESLLTSQSGVSKHIRDLEEELGVEIFVRRGKRLLGLTEPGREVAAIADRI